jgi:4-hydroxy-3-polyprenylbenzoate decarboxylase
MSERLVVAVTGASGAIYAVRFLRACLELDFAIEMVVSDYGQRLKKETVQSWLERTYGPRPGGGSVRLHAPGDMGAAIASGSQRWRAMVVVPCSMKTLSGIAHGSASNLVERAADVTLKERRPLILVPRETPLNLIHLENLRTAALAGATVVPAMPAFYFGPRSVEDLADFVVGRVLAVLGIDHDLFPAWKE